MNNAGARGNLPQTSGTPDQNLTQKETPNRKPVMFNDLVNKAETYLALQAVQSQWSFQSFDTLPEVLRVADPDSKVFAKLMKKRSKASRVVSYGLAPFFKEKLIASLASLPQNATNWRIRKASLLVWGGEKRLGRKVPSQNGVIGGRAAADEESEEALLTSLNPWARSPKRLLSKPASHGRR